MKCNSCSFENSPGNKFCTNCGKPLNQSNKVCVNGHVYDASLLKCPFCSSDFRSASSNIPLQDAEKTKVLSSSKNTSGKTVVLSTDSDSHKDKSTGCRRLVGWLITFTWKPEGEDFKLYEGRNLLSGENPSDVKLNDPAVSSPHCMLLYRNSKMRIKDELSTNGTFVNGKAIEETDLNDGDIIKVGATELKYRSA